MPSARLSAVSRLATGWRARAALSQAGETFEVSVAHVDVDWLSSFPVDSAVARCGYCKAADALEGVARDKRQSKTYVTRKLALVPRFNSNWLPGLAAPRTCPKECHVPAKDGSCRLALMGLGNGSSNGFA